MCRCSGKGGAGESAACDGDEAKVLPVVCVPGGGTESLKQQRSFLQLIATFASLSQLAQLASLAELGTNLPSFIYNFLSMSVTHWWREIYPKD